MKISYFSPCPTLARTKVHIHVIINYLKQFPRLRNTTRLYLGPDRHVVQRYLESSRADELGLDCITEEECHHAGVDLVLQHPGSPAGSVHSEEGEGVEGGENHEDEEKFTNTNYLGGLQPVATGREVVSTDGDIWVFLL